MGFDILKNDFDITTISNNGMTITLQEIEQTILETAQDFFIDDLSKAPHTTFKGVLRVTGQKLFRHSKILITYEAVGEDGSFNTLNNRMNFNLDLLNNQCFYIYNYICEKYNKVKCLEGYLLLYSIDLDSYDDYLKTNPLFMRTIEKISCTRKEALKDKLVDSKNIVGTLAVFNDENNRTVNGDNRKPDNTTLLEAIRENQTYITQSNN